MGAIHIGNLFHIVKSQDATGIIGGSLLVLINWNDGGGNGNSKGLLTTGANTIIWFGGGGGGGGGGALWCPKFSSNEDLFALIPRQPHAKGVCLHIIRQVD